MGECEDCRWYEPLPEKDQPAPESPSRGRCRRNSPIVHIRANATSKGAMKATWPLTRGNDWCGDFQERLDMDDWEDPRR